MCDKYGVLLIADEVITGFGRTGKMFASEHWGVTPDIMTVAKGITSGYIPMGGAITRGNIADAFVGSQRVSFRHVITFGGHPVASAAALRNIQIMEDEDLPGNSARMGAYLLDGLKELQEKHQMIGDVRGLGLMCGMELVRDRETKETYPAERRPGEPADRRVQRQRVAPAGQRQHERDAAPLRHLQRDRRDHLENGHGVHRGRSRTGISLKGFN